MAEDTVEIDLRIVHMADHAVLVSDDAGISAWVPLALVDFTGEAGDVVTVTMPGWLALDRGFM